MLLAYDRGRARARAAGVRLRLRAARARRTAVRRRCRPGAAPRARRAGLRRLPLLRAQLGPRAPARQRRHARRGPRARRRRRARHGEPQHAGPRRPVLRRAGAQRRPGAPHRRPADPPSRPRDRARAAKPTAASCCRPRTTAMPRRFGLIHTRTLALAADGGLPRRRGRPRRRRGRGALRLGRAGGHPFPPAPAGGRALWPPAAPPS